VAVTFIGYGGGRGIPYEHLAWPAVGIAAFVMCQPNVPFLCDFRRAVGLSPTYPYKEIADFLAQQIDLVDDVLDTLRYVDCALLARRITADCLFSVGLMDEICPPSTVFAAFNEVPGNKEIAVYPFGVHDLPRGHHERQLRHLRERLT
jgi:cephalosporin-C deacetylase